MYLYGKYFETIRDSFRYVNISHSTIFNQMARDLVLPDDEANRNFSVGRKISQHPVHTSSSQPKDSTWPNFLHPVACQFTRYLFLLLAANTDIKGKSRSTGRNAFGRRGCCFTPNRLALSTRPAASNRNLQGRIASCAIRTRPFAFYPVFLSGNLPAGAPATDACERIDLPSTRPPNVESAGQEMRAQKR